MSERVFQLVLSAVLFLGTVWYALQMASYPDNAGRVPVIVAVVAAAALAVQMVVQVRALRAARTPAPEPASVGTGLLDDELFAKAEERANEVDNALAGYDTLLALDRVRRWRFVAIAAFSVLFYVSALMVGFVVTTGVLITLFLLVAKERLVTALVAGVVSAAAVYALVVLVLDLPALDGYLF